MSGIYLHIPFCKKRCHYCDFYSTTGEERRQAYVQALCRETELRHDYLTEPVETIYFGGGTPSQLVPEEVGQVMEQLGRSFDLSHCSERTFELNPDDLTLDYLTALRAVGINRLSIGIQSFDNNLLQKINRRHDAQQAIEAVRLAQSLGFDNISIDLMYGLPGQTLALFEESLQTALSLNVQHISSYHLTYEEGTVMYQWLQEGIVAEPDEELSLGYFELLIDTLQGAGFVHYEISNWALPGRESRHNSSYWRGTPYLGLGASAHSFNGTERSWNESSIEEYIAGVELGERASSGESIDLETAFNDYVITALRTSEGIDTEYIGARFGAKLLRHTLAAAEPRLVGGALKTGRGLGVVADTEPSRLTLTRSGIFVSDSLFEELLYV